MNLFMLERLHNFMNINKNVYILKLTNTVVTFLKVAFNFIFYYKN